MPELPEVETTINGLKSKVLNRTFVDIWTDFTRQIKKPNLENFKKEIKGKKIVNIWRRGKNIIFDLSEEYALLVHMKMTGHFLYGKWSMKNGLWKPEISGPLSDKNNLFIHLVFSLDDGNMIALSDLRKFAKVELWKRSDLLNSEEFRKIGPEPLEESFTFAMFSNILKNRGLNKKGGKRTGKIKQVLMDPEVIAGIGNIYSDEALWHAKINPFKEVSELKEEEKRTLYDKIKYVLKKGLELGGESFADYRNVDGEKGDFDSEKEAYQREGEKCSRCSTIIVRKKIGGRSTCFCPVCQKL